MFKYLYSAFIWNRQYGDQRMTLKASALIAQGALLNCLEYQLDPAEEANLTQAIRVLQARTDPNHTLTKVNLARSKDDIEEQAFDLLKTEKKYGPTMLKNKLGITLGVARGVIKTLVDSGRLPPSGEGPLVKLRPDDEDLTDKPEVKRPKKEKLEKGKRGADKPEQPAEPKHDLKHDLVELIGSLPSGTDVLLKSPYRELACLPEKQRAVYLAGHDLKDLVTAESLENATKEGVDRSLVNQVLLLKGKARPTPSEDSLLDASQFEQQIVDFSTNVVNGGEIFNLLAAKGLTKTVLKHMAMIQDHATAGGV
jgi:hypothetical protein